MLRILRYSQINFVIRLAVVTAFMTSVLSITAQTATPTPTPESDPITAEMEVIFKAANVEYTKATKEGYQAAIALYRKGAEFSKANKRKYSQAVFLLSAGRTQSLLGIPNSETIKTYEEAIAIGQEEDVTIQSDLYTDLAWIYAKTGNPSRSLELYDKALTIMIELKSEPGMVGVMNDVAIVYNNLGDIKSAMGFYEKIIVLERKFPDKHLLAASINNLAFAHYNLGNYAKALELYTESYDIGVANDMADIKAATKTGIAETLLKLGRRDESLKVGLEAIELTRAVGNPVYLADAHYSVGMTYHAMGDLPKAVAYFNKAVALQQDGVAREEESNTLAQLMQVWSELSQPDLAILYGKRLVNLLQGVRANMGLLDKETKKLFLERKESNYRTLGSLLIAQGRLPEAQAVLDLLKEQEYVQLTTLRSGETPDTVPYSKAEGDTIAKIEKLGELGKRQVELQGLKAQKGSLTTAEQTELDQTFADLEVANKAFREALATLGKSETSVGQKVAEIQSEKNLQRSLGKLRDEMNTGVVAIYTVIGKDSGDNADGKSKFGWAIMVSPEGRKAYPIDVTDLEDTVLQFRNVLSSAKYDPLPLSQKLYNAIFRQTSAQQKTTLEKDLGSLLAKYPQKTIMWSLDGVLRYVPMAALNDGKNYLVEKYRNTVFTKESLLLLGEKDSAKWETLGLGVSEAKTVDKQNFAALDGTKRELQDIVRQPNEKTGILEGTRRMNSEFTKSEAIKLWQEGKYQAVHIASHFSFNPTDQASSFLVIGDGKLTFADIQDKDNLFGSVDLMTLSACDTAMSGNGKESEGFPFLMQSLGAKTVIASLWKVSDIGTPELMIRFYKLRADNPSIGKGEAFRLAQVSLLKGETKVGKTEFGAATRSDLVKEAGETDLPLYDAKNFPPLAHPHYWASFILIGNWR